MRAYVVHVAGGPDALELTEIAEPSPPDGWVSIEVKAFGLNRAEAVTRAGGSGDAVPFPRVIGIEAVGIIVDPGTTDLAVGQTVATAMGGLGRTHDGSYAEMTTARRSNVFPLDTRLDWATLAAVPETFLTAWGCLLVTNALGASPRVLVRPGASALGLAIAQIVVERNGEVVGVTRSASKRDGLLARGMTEVLVTDGPVAEIVRDRWPDGATSVVDTIASDASVADDVAMLADGGTVCLAGSLAESYGTATSAGVADAFERDDVTYYSSETLDSSIETSVLQTIVDRVEDGMYDPGVDTVFGFDELIEAHRRMEANAFSGKAVVVF